MFYIRADANEIIGTGHVMRCLSIAEEMRRQGEDVTFIFADERTRKLVDDKGFSCICLNSVWDDLDGEIKVLSCVIQDNNIKTLLIDSYYITENYLQQIKKLAKVIYIDDLAAFAYPVDMLVNYNIFADAEKYKNMYGEEYEKIDFLLGCEYAPLRQEFVGVDRVIAEHSKNILITSGGTDIYNLTGNLLKNLKNQEWFCDMEIHAIIGRFNNHKELLEKDWGDYKNIQLHYNIPNIADYMKKCDIAVSAGGVTTYELCACGIPAILYTLADNQLEIAHIASEKAAIYYAGDVRENMDACVDNIIARINELLHDVDSRRDISAKMQSVVDGNGCKHLIDKIKS